MVLENGGKEKLSEIETPLETAGEKRKRNIGSKTSAKVTKVK